MPVSASRDRQGRFGSRRDTELAEDRRDVHARGLRADEEPLTDLPVAEPLGHELEHLPLARGQLPIIGRPRIQQRRGIKSGQARRSTEADRLTQLTDLLKEI